MLENFGNLILVGLYEGLIWFPFVLGVGILYRYLRIIDISIEGAAVASGIAAVGVFNLTQNYLLSYFFSLLTGLWAYSTVYLLIVRFRVHPILTGIIFTLIIHSLASILIGESLVLKGSSLFSGVFSFSWIVFFTSLFLILSTELFFRTNTGLRIRYSGRKEHHNYLRADRYLVFLAFAFTSFIITTGSFIYVHKQGVVRGGGGFEFLIAALGSFLITDKLTELLIKKLIIKSKTVYSKRTFLILTFMRSPVFKALAGSLVFQTIAIFVIYYTPNPSWWKFLFAIILLPGIARMPEKHSSFVSKVKQTHKSISLINISFSYASEYLRQPVFSHLNAEFRNGINIIWGENGTGKSTLLKIIGQAIPPDEGKIIASQNLTYPRSVFYLSQNPFDSLNREMTVFENLCTSLSQQGLYITRISEIKHLLNLKLNEYQLDGITTADEQMFYQIAGHLSGGQAQRTVLFMSVLNDPEIILADEPSSGMDDRNFKGLLQVMRSFELKEKVIIIVTHDIRMKAITAKHYQLKDGSLNEISADHEVIT